MLLAFLTPRVFSMDLIRHNLIVEIEHFLKFKKSTNIKYPWEVGPFPIKNKIALPMIDNLFKEMGFHIEPAVDYKSQIYWCTRLKFFCKGHYFFDA